MPINLKWGRPTQAERDASELKCTLDPGTALHDSEILVYVSGLEPGKTYEIEVKVKESGGDGAEVSDKLEVEDLNPSPVPELPPPDPRD